jgi:hypothetical protein
LRQALVRASERSWHRERLMVTQQPEACRDVRRAVVRRGDQPEVHQACCLEPALRSAQQASPGALREPQVLERALPSGLVPSGEVAPQGPLQEARLRAAEASA